MPPGPKPGRLPVPSGTNPKATAPSPKGRPTPEGGVRGGRWFHPKVVPWARPKAVPVGQRPKALTRSPLRFPFAATKASYRHRPGGRKPDRYLVFAHSFRCFATSVSAGASRPRRAARRCAPSAGKEPSRVSAVSSCPPRGEGAAGCRSGRVPVGPGASLAGCRSGRRRHGSRRPGNGVWRRTAVGAVRNAENPEGALAEASTLSGFSCPPGSGRTPFPVEARDSGRRPCPRGGGLSPCSSSRGSPSCEPAEAGSRCSRRSGSVCGLAATSIRRSRRTSPRASLLSRSPEGSGTVYRSAGGRQVGATVGFRERIGSFRDLIPRPGPDRSLFPAARRQGRRTMPRWTGSVTRGE
ncbi:hypothetical protein BH24ACT7_BH24ACT7_11620 [soil metagenome]